MESKFPTSAPRCSSPQYSGTCHPDLQGAFLSILAGVDRDFPISLWDMILPQTKLTLNLLRQATLLTYMSAWEYYNSPINYDATLFIPIGCKVSIHNKPVPRKNWDFRASDEFGIGSDHHHYRCHKVLDTTTKAIRVRNTVNFYHSYLTKPRVTPEDRIIDALQLLSCAIKYVPITLHTKRLEYLTRIRDIFLPKPTPLPFFLPLHSTKPAQRETPPAAPRVIAQRPPAPAPPPSPVHNPAPTPWVDKPAAPPALQPRISIGN